MNIYRLTYKVELWPDCGLLQQTPQIFSTKSEGLKHYSRLNKELQHTKKPYKITLEHITVSSDKEHIMHALAVEHTGPLVTESIVLRQEKNCDHRIKI